MVMSSILFGGSRGVGPNLFPLRLAVSQTCLAPPSLAVVVRPSIGLFDDGASGLTDRRTHRACAAALSRSLIHRAVEIGPRTELKDCSPSVRSLEKLLPSGKKGNVLLGSLYSFIWMRGCDILWGFYVSWQFHGIWRKNLNSVG